MSAVLKRALYSLKVSKVMEAKSMDKVREEYDQVSVVRDWQLIIR